MSTNVHIHGERYATVTVKGQNKTIKDYLKFNAVQTSSDETRTIMNSPDKIEAYIKYVQGRSFVEQVPIYAEDDVLCEYEPIAHEEYDWTVQHLKKFQEFLETCQKEDYTVRFEAW